MFSTAPSVARGAAIRDQELQESVVAVGPWSQNPTLQPHTLTRYAGQGLTDGRVQRQKVSMPQKEDQENLKVKPSYGQQY